MLKSIFLWNGLGFFGFPTALNFVVLEEAVGSPIKQKLKRCRKGFG
jgi:hypothetical protein